jgi:hypothetical protein
MDPVSAVVHNQLSPARTEQALDRAARRRTVPNDDLPTAPPAANFRASSPQPLVQHSEIKPEKGRGGVDFLAMYAVNVIDRATFKLYKFVRGLPAIIL